MKEKACKECGKITELDVCRLCKGHTSTDWVGYVAIVNPEISRIAKKMGIKVKGKYALKVR